MFSCKRTPPVAVARTPGRERTAALLKQEVGLTLIEVLVATVVLAVGIAGTFSLINTSVKTSAQTHDREGAVSLAREILEDAHTIPFAQLTPSTVVEKLQAMQGLENASSSSSTWQVKRGSSEGASGETRAGTTYTVTASECSIDSPKDGLAKNSELTEAEATTFCEGHKGKEEWKEGNAADPAPVDFKRITVKVSWQSPTTSTRKPYVEEVTLLNAAGEPTGLSVSELKITSPYNTTISGSTATSPLITEATTKELTFSVNASEGASALRWSLEGAAQSPAPTLEKGTTWTFKWKIEGLSDGTYEVSAQAITSTGVLGPPITIPVTLLRSEPVEPKGVKGGFNEVYVEGTKERAIELQWEANTERNVIGYRVSGPKGLVCPSSSSELSLALSCIEVPTAYASGSTPAYTVTALYHNVKGELTEGKKKSLTLGPTETPNAPTGLTLTKNEDGSITLKWNAPVGGATVAFYWIYRGSTNYPSRYSTASASETSFNDTDASVAHTYWVTAVSSTMTESPIAGPVSG